MSFVCSSQCLVVSCYVFTKEAAACLKMNVINDEVLIYLKKIKGFVGILYAVCVR